MDTNKNIQHMTFLEADIFNNESNCRYRVCHYISIKYFITSPVIAKVQTATHLIISDMTGI